MAVFCVGDNVISKCSIFDMFHNHLDSDKELKIISMKNTTIYGSMLDLITEDGVKFKFSYIGTETMGFLFKRNIHKNRREKLSLII